MEVKYHYLKPTRNKLIAFIGGIATTYIIASASQSLYVLYALMSVGANMSFGVFIEFILRDLYYLSFTGKYVSYGLAIVIGFTIALPAASIASYIIPLPKPLIYSCAGATAVAVILYIVKLNFYDLNLFFGIRGVAAYITQLFAGALGGWIYLLVRSRSSD